MAEAGEEILRWKWTVVSAIGQMAAIAYGDTIAE